jgi:hypothetical protein
MVTAATVRYGDKDQKFLNEMKKMNAWALIVTLWSHSLVRNFPSVAEFVLIEPTWKRSNLEAAHSGVVRVFLGGSIHSCLYHHVNEFFDTTQDALPKILRIGPTAS